MRNIEMSAIAEEWKSQLVRLPLSDRAEIAGFLLESLKTDSTSKFTELTEWTDLKNARRCLLVDREIDGTLTAAERRELKALQAELSRYRQLVAPLPIRELRSIHDQLLQQVENLKAKKGDDVSFRLPR